MAKNDSRSRELSRRAIRKNGRQNLPSVIESQIAENLSFAQWVIDTDEAPDDSNEDWRELLEAQNADYHTTVGTYQRVNAESIVEIWENGGMTQTVLGAVALNALWTPETGWIK